MEEKKRKRTASQAGRWRRRKGAEAERELVVAAKDAGFSASRDKGILESTGKELGWDVEIDLRPFGHAYVQCKSRRRITLLAEIVQSITAAKTRDPYSHYVWQLRCDRVSPIIVMRRDDWLTLMRILYGSAGQEAAPSDSAP